MNVFSKIGSFINRHRKKFVTGGIIIAGSILLSKYGQKKLKEWQENQAKEFFDRTRRQHHFETTEQNCNQTILKLLPRLEEQLNNIINTEEIIAKLRENPENKLELWEKLKILVFTKATCMIYSTVILVLMMRTQLNILGGLLFKKPNEIEIELQEKYLLICNKLMEVGIKNIQNSVECKYLEIVGPMTLTRKLSLKDLEDIFWAVQSTVAMSDLDPLNNLSKHFQNDSPEFEQEKAVFKNMVTDTYDILDSDEVKGIAVHCINRGFALLNDQLAEYFVPIPKIQELPSNSKSDEFVSPLNSQIPMAKLLPIVNGLFSAKFPNALVKQLLANDKIKTLGANIYESFSNV